MPSRMVLQGIKERMTAATTGHKLLKQKSDQIKSALNKMLIEILTVKRRVGESLSKSAFSHTEAVWAAGEINHQVIENTRDATYKIKPSIKPVMGVKLPQFQKMKDDSHKGEMLGISRGGEAVQKCRMSYAMTLDDLIRLASLQSSVKTLDEALKTTNRRVNALEFVIMPMLANTIKYINAELDELEREDSYRIKKVKDLRSKGADVTTGAIDEDMDADELKRLQEEEEQKLQSATSVLDSYGKDADDVTGIMFADAGSASGRSGGGRAAAPAHDDPEED